MDGLVGRDGERAIVARFVAAASAGPAVLAIEGEAGIGKTALFRHAVGVASSAGVRTLHTSPGEQEAQLTFTGLTDLLTTVEPELFGRLPDPQRHALAVAALREPAGEGPPDERAIGTGLTTLLTGLARDGPVVVAVDDVQWLDAPSLRALTFAVRRAAGPVGVLAARRLPSGGPDPGDLGPAEAWRERIDLAGLSLGATFVLVQERLGVALPRVRLNRLWEACQGNPLLALELARAAERIGDEWLSGELPLPERLDSVLGDRIATLAGEARRACLAVACTGRATTDLMRAVGLDSGLAAAEAAGVLALRHQRVRFTHPLLAAAALSRATESERREMHAELAAVVTDAEERARHLALADPAPTADTAAALAGAASGAEQRGAISAAIELARLAVEHTPPGDTDDLWRRRIALARYLFEAGESAAARDVLADRDAECPAGRLRAEAELLMAEVEFQMGSMTAVAVARTALQHAGADRRLRAQALLTLSVIDSASPQREYAAEALRCVEHLDPPDPLTQGWAMIADTACRILAGEPVDPDEVHAAVAVERAGRVWRVSDNAAVTRPALLRWLGATDAALEALAELEQRAEQEGNEGEMPYVLGHRANCLQTMARFREAAEVAARHLAHADATAQAGQRVQGLYLTACADAYLGRFDAATAAVDEAYGPVAEWDDPWMLAGVAGIRGVIALARGQVAEARRQFDLWQAENRRAGVSGPALTPYHVDHVEALLACGDRVAAGEVTDTMIAAGDRARRRSVQAAGHHCRALLAAHDGDLRGALTHVGAALAIDSQALNDFARGRALVLQGTLHRRLKGRAAARAALEEARSLFESVNAAHWVGVTDAELARLGQRGTDRFALTDTERRVAELAARGLTNREVAERAFISAKTVEANLARVYRKLGIRSRAELGARMSAEL